MASSKLKGTFVIIKCEEANGSESVEVGHHNWLQGSKDGTIKCWWPPGNYKLAAQKGYLPDHDSWMLCDCLVVGWRGTYKEANAYAEEARYLSSFETGNEQDGGKRKAMIQNSSPPTKKVLRETSNVDNCSKSLESQEHSFEKDCEKQGTGKNSRNGSSGNVDNQRTTMGCYGQLFNEEDDRDGSDVSCPNGNRKTSLEAEAMTAASSHRAMGRPTELQREEKGSCSGICDSFQKTTKRRLDAIIENQQHLKGMLQAINTRLDGANADGNFELDQVQSADALERLFTKMKTDDEYNRGLRVYLSSLGGKNLKDTTRRMLTMVARKTIWKLYNLMGVNRKDCKKIKKPFIKTPLYTIMQKILLSGNKIPDIEDAIGAVLKEFGQKAEEAPDESDA